ncbi:ABC transporter ATP-binding protein [Haloarcula litorea]|uniref:ABC transporter ATP-binding protein n=1 Tax=Haloarcula litorea TaxID=3032579 RepID=UPI0023E86359|nr:ABC transporter ATP-binding protein [Halomicroarcula sp. GDY20]
MAAIDTTALTKRFGPVTAVDELSLTVETGEVFGFLGPNGAGKSTVINLLLGYMTPTTGSATVLGHDIETESRALRARTGVLPENVAVYDRLTAREHVAAAIRFTDADDDPAALLDRVGLDEAAWDRAAGGFSTGMAQRLALATALVGDPDLLVLDEPQSGLDPNGMEEVRGIVEAEAAAGTTVFFSSHILPEVEAVSDRIGIMRDGDVAAVDTLAGLREAMGADDVLTVTMATRPATLDPIRDVDGVQSVEADGSDVTVVCRTPRSKVEVLTTLEAGGRVADFDLDARSLQRLFTAVTTDGAGVVTESDGAAVAAERDG